MLSSSTSLPLALRGFVASLLARYGAVRLSLRALPFARPCARSLPASRPRGPPGPFLRYASSLPRIRSAPLTPARPFAFGSGRPERQRPAAAPRSHKKPIKSSRAYARPRSALASRPAYRLPPDCLVPKRDGPRAFSLHCGSAPVKVVAGSAGRSAARIPPMTGARVDGMKTRVSSRSVALRPCVWCGQPVGRLSLVVAGPAQGPGVSHRWLFCGLSCLVAWSVCEWRDCFGGLPLEPPS